MSPRTLMLLILAPLLAVDAFLGFEIHELTLQREKIKEDYSQINSIRYGLLSVDAWKGRLETILKQRIGTFTVTPRQEEVVRSEISKALDALITQADAMLHKPQHSFSAKMKELALRVVVNTKDLRKEVPEFTQAVLEELEEPGHVARFKKLANGILEDSAAKTHDKSEDTARYRELLDRYQAADADDFNRIAAHRLKSLDGNVNACAGVMLDSVLAFLFAWWLARKKTALHKSLFTLSVAFDLLLLLVGLGSPMIDIDARIKTVDFLLWGAHVRFVDQILYFRSKTIFQMVSILMETGKAESFIVGVLILVFSILFPVCKLIAMESYLRAGPRLRKNALVEFFAFKSTKWSMANVTVVAIFLAYVGFQQILKSQLEGFNVHSAAAEIIATNNTSLQPGYVLFTTFVLFGFALSEILKRIRRPAGE